MFEELTRKYIESIEWWGPVWAGGEHWGSTCQIGGLAGKWTKEGSNYLFLFYQFVTCLRWKVQPVPLKTTLSCSPFGRTGLFSFFLVSEWFWFLWFLFLLVLASYNKSTSCNLHNWARAVNSSCCWWNYIKQRAGPVLLGVLLDM